MPDGAARSAAAERQRRARARRMAAEMVVPLLVDIDVTEGLIALGLLPAQADEDRQQIAVAVAAFLRDQLQRVTRDAALSRELVRPTPAPTDRGSNR